MKSSSLALTLTHLACFAASPPATAAVREIVILYTNDWAVESSFDGE